MKSIIDLYCSAYLTATGMRDTHRHSAVDHLMSMDGERPVPKASLLRRIGKSMRWLLSSIGYSTAQDGPSPIADRWQWL